MSEKLANGESGPTKSKLRSKGASYMNNKKALRFNESADSSLEFEKESDQVELVLEKSVNVVDEKKKTRSLLFESSSESEDDDIPEQNQKRVIIFF